MDFSFNEEQKALVALAKEFCQKEVDRRALQLNADKPYSEHPDRNEMMARIPWDLLDKAQAVGLRQLVIPKKYGGGGMGYAGDWVTVSAVAEAMGYYAGHDFYRFFGYSWMIMATILAYAPEEVQEIWCTDFMKGRTLGGGLATTEPDHGSDMMLPYDEPGYTGKVTARLEGNEWVLNGDKAFSSLALVSNYIIVTARTDPDGPISKSQTLFLVPTYSPGWSYAVNRFCGDEAGLNIRQTFDNVRIPKNYMVTELNGAAALRKSAAAGKNIHFMAMLGEAQYEYDQIRAYAKKRVQGGKPIIEHPNIQLLLARSDIMLKTSRLLQYKYAWDCDQTKPGQFINPVLGFYNNYWYKRVFMDLFETGSEVYGGMAPNKDLTFEHFVRANFSILHGGSTGQMSLMKGLQTDLKFH
jgi:alkylation response protein AidB-like acyl-CoA dehydrogenase